MTPTIQDLATDPESRADVLVVRLSALGDVLFTLPAIQALREARPHWTFHWAIEDRASSILDLVPSIAERIVYPRRLLGARRPLASARALLAHGRVLRNRKFDVALDFQGNLKSSAHLRIARARRRLGFGAGHTKEKAHWWVDESVVPAADVVHRIDKAMCLARALVPELPATPPAPELVIPDEAMAGAERALGETGVREPNGYVVLHPGTSAFGAFKRWSPERFAQVGDAVAAHGLESLVTYGPGEEELAAAVVRAARSEAVRMGPRTRSLGELAAVLSRARVFVGSDSAPLHLAAFLGRAVIALFGPKDPALYGPRFAPRRIVRVHLPCAPCKRRRCPDAQCMAEIRTNMVVAAVQDLLDTVSAEPAAG